MNISPDEVARIAGSLTKAQREAMSEAAVSDHIVAGLHGYGLTDCADHPARLTDLGLAVRSLLLEKETKA